jgi:hypothetical protein
MLAPFIIELLIASGLLILVGWASDAVSASMRDGQFNRNYAFDKGSRATIPLRTPRRYGDSGAEWTSRLVPSVTTPARLALCTSAAVRPVPCTTEQRKGRESYS